ncbi:MAG: hypothetical protein O3C28_18540 [Proteobacteria bacterium]|nr:hypothetical protein [Pseudomonadota bacterium]
MQQEPGDQTFDLSSKQLRGLSKILQAIEKLEKHDMACVGSLDVYNGGEKVGAIMVEWVGADSYWTYLPHIWSWPVKEDAETNIAKE